MKKILMWGGLGILAIIVIASIFSGGDSTSTNNNTPSKQEQQTEYSTGETISLKNHQLVVNSYQAPYISSNVYDKPQSSENDYVLVNVTITNTGSSDLSVNSFGFELEDENGVKRNPSIAIADNQLSTTSLSSGGKVTGNIVFEAKKNSQTLKLHYSPGIFGGSEITVNLN